MLDFNFNPFPVLKTERLVLRNLNLDDAEPLFDIRSNPTTMQYIPRPLARNTDDAIALIEMMTDFTAKNEKINWAITEKGIDKLIGVIGYVNVKHECLRAEVGYILHPHQQRKGITYEALQAVLDYGFTVMKLHSVEAIIRPENTASIKLAEKAGFVREAYFKDYIFHNGQFFDETYYSLIRG